VGLGGRCGFRWVWVGAFLRGAIVAQANSFPHVNYLALKCTNKVHAAEPLICTLVHISLVHFCITPRYSFSCTRPDGISECFTRVKDEFYTGVVRGGNVWELEADKVRVGVGVGA